MSEVPLYARLAPFSHGTLVLCIKPTSTPRPPRHQKEVSQPPAHTQIMLHGYLAHKKLRTPGTLQWAYA